MTKVFLSYCREDGPLIESFREAFHRRRVPVWLDVLETKPGDNLPASLERGMRESDGAVIFLSETYLAKGWTKAEMRYLTCRTIRNGNLRLAIVHLDGCEVPPLLEPLIRNTPNDADLVAQFFADAFMLATDASSAEKKTSPVGGNIEVANFLAALPDVAILGLAQLILTKGSDAVFRQQTKPIPFCSKVHGSVLIELIQPVPDIPIDELSAARERLKNYQRHCASLDDQISRGGLAIFGAAFEIELERKTISYQSTAAEIRWRIEQLIASVSHEPERS